MLYKDRGDFLINFDGPVKCTRHGDILDNRNVILPRQFDNMFGNPVGALCQDLWCPHCLGLVQYRHSKVCWVRDNYIGFLHTAIMRMRAILRC